MFRFFFQLFIGHHLSANFCLTPVSFVKTTESYGFHLSSSVGKPRMTPVTSIKTTEAYAVCQQIIRDLYLLGHHLGSTFKQAGLITASDQTVRAVHSINSRIDLKMLARKGECAG